MTRELKESNVLLTHAILYPDGAAAGARQAKDVPPRSAKLPLHGLHLLCHGLEMLFEKLPENVHSSAS
jgi:hypothetical protein